MRPVTTITLNKTCFRADEPITGFVDIDINQSTPGEWDPKLWVVKVRLVGYAQMDTQWQEQAKNPNWQEKARYETAPIEECSVTLRSNDGPIYVKPGVSNRVRSLPFRIQLSPAHLIASFNAQKGLFLVDYLLSATTRRKCPHSGWNLLKLETRTFVTITPPEAEIQRPLQVTPYSPPLDDMDLFRLPFMQTIRFNYSTQLTPTTLSPSHRMSLYFPLPLYEPEEISLSLTSTLTLRHNQIVNRHTDTTLLPYETYYRPDTGGEEVLVEFDIPIKTAQTMEFKFGKGGSMTMTHALRVTMHATLFPSDKSKSAKKIWTVDLPVTIRGRHYVDAPLSPPLSVITSPADTASPELPRSSNKTSDGSQASWIRDRFEIDGSSDEETAPNSAVSGTSSFATSTGYSGSAELLSESDSPRRGSELESPQRGIVSPPLKRRQLRAVNLDQNDMPPQKPAPTGPLPEPPQSATPSPEFRRMSPEQTRPRTARKKRSAENQSRSARGREAVRSEPQIRSRSVPAAKEPVSFYDPFLTQTTTGDYTMFPSSEPPSASSVSTKSTMPPTPTAQTAVPSYYHSKPSYYLDNGPKIITRPRANTAGSAQSPITPITPVSPETQIPSPWSSPQTRVKFTNPEVTEYDSPPSHASSPPETPASTTSSTTKLPFPRSPPESSFPFRPISPPPRRNSATPGHQSARMTSPPPQTAVSEPRGLVSPARAPPPVPPQSRIPVVAAGRHQMPLSPPRLIDTPAQYGQAFISLPGVTSPATYGQPSRPAPTPISTSGRSPPSASRLPTARPPLPSQSKARILSMATDTTSSTATRPGTMSTAATSRSGAASAGANVARPTVKRRPTAPALFPPLPPATLAVHQNRLAQLARDEEPTSPTGPSRSMGRRQSNNWI